MSYCSCVMNFLHSISPKLNFLLKKWILKIGWYFFLNDLPILLKQHWKPLWSFFEFLQFLFSSFFPLPPAPSSQFREIWLKIFKSQGDTTWREWEWKQEVKYNQRFLESVNRWKGVPTVRTRIEAGVSKWLWGKIFERYFGFHSSHAYLSRVSGDWWDYGKDPCCLLSVQQHKSSNSLCD